MPHGPRSLSDNGRSLHVRAFLMSYLDIDLSNASPSFKFSLFARFASRISSMVVYTQEGFGFIKSS